jgi:hypothetical protein
MLALLGLEDGYEHQGRVISEFLDEHAELPVARDREHLLELLGAAYKQLNAPVGRFALATLRVTTRAVRSGSPSDDRTYTGFLVRLGKLAQERDELSGQIAHLLEAVWFHGRSANDDATRALVVAAQGLVERAEALATGP